MPIIVWRKKDNYFVMVVCQLLVRTADIALCLIAFRK
jgi:hypothetical protein